MSAINDNRSAMDRDDHLLNQLNDDMDVYDSNNDHIGEVEYIHFGEGDNATEVRPDEMNDDIDTVTEAVAEVFGAFDNIPKELQERLYARGFARVEGALEPTFFFTPDQIDRIDGDDVHLNVPKDNLTQS